MYLRYLSKQNVTLLIVGITHLATAPTDLQSETVKSKHTKGKKNSSFRRGKPEPTSRKVHFETLRAIETIRSGQVHVTAQHRNS